MGSTVPLNGFLSAPDTATGAIDQTGFDLYHLINTSIDPSACTINGTGEAFPSTGFVSGSVPVAVDSLQGLGGWSGSFSGRYPNGAPAVGHQGLVTFANGYVLKCNAWSMTLNAESFDDTGFDTIPPTWMDFLPGQISGSGSFTCVVDDATAITMNTAGAATFRMNNESGTDNTLAGNIVITGFSPAVALGGGRNQVTYTFAVNGNITSAGDNTLFPAGALATPDSTEIVLRASGSRTYTGFAFWTSLTIGAQVGSPITASVNFKGTGALTAA
jgi:hypothetical protein